MSARANPAGKAPKAASWAWAETLVPEVEQSAAARDEAGPLGVGASGRGTTTTLTLLARVLDARAVVEIGTGSGVSGLALFAGMRADGILTSIDIESEHQAVARRMFTEHGIRSQRFRLISGAAIDVLPKLSDAAYDLVYVDADKYGYPGYVEQAVRLLRPGGVVAVDNTLWHDKVADESNSEDDTEAIREAIDWVTSQENLVASLLPVGDGLLVAVKA